MRPFIVKYRYCNCTDLYVRDGIFRTLLIHAYPALAKLSKEPCKHWMTGVAEVPSSPDTEDLDPEMATLVDKNFDKLIWKSGSPEQKERP